jgi:hypothetical protein
VLAYVFRATAWSGISVDADPAVIGLTGFARIAYRL